MTWAPLSVFRDIPDLSFRTQSSHGVLRATNRKAATLFLIILHVNCDCGILPNRGPAVFHEGGLVNFEPARLEIVVKARAKPKTNEKPNDKPAGKPSRARRAAIAR